MTIPTPTSNPVGAAPQAGAGLPDPSVLAQLANAFFSALPGQAPQGLARPPATAQVPNLTAPAGSPLAGPAGIGTGIPGTSLPPGRVPGSNLLPAAPSTQILALGNRGPALLPHASAQNGLPDRAVTIAPALDSRAGGVALGVPQAHGAPAHGAPAAPLAHAATQPGVATRDVTTPGVATPGVSTPGVATHDAGTPRVTSSGATPRDPFTAHVAAHPTATPTAATSHARNPHAPPYYFLAESGAHGYPGGPAAGGPAAGAPTALPHDAVTPAGWGLPGAADIQALLSSPSRHGAQAAPGAASHGAAVPGAPYYTVDDNAYTGRHRQPDRGVPAYAGSAHPPFDVHAIRRDFPILQERVNGRPLVWFDNAATTHKPQSVIDRIAYFYAHENSNIHRAAHALAGRATDAYEAARSKAQHFIGAASPDEILFVRGTTEAINLIAKTWGAKHIGAGDEIIVSHLEHHANIAPWQQLAAQTGAVLRVIPVDDTGQVLIEDYKRLLNDRTRLVSVTQVSNALGTVVPVKDIIALAHRAGAKALVDGAQSVSHMRVDVQALDADFFVFSGHKLFGPTGIGVAYAKRAILEDMPPWQGGGNMIADVTFERTVFQPPPNRFEAGTGNIADAVGLGAAIDYINRIGIENIARYEHDLLAYATQALQSVPGVRLVGTAADKASVLSFVLKGYETEEVGRALNEEGIAVRSGHHCAQPILRRFGLEATVRPSLAFYNTTDEVDALVRVVRTLSARR